MLYRCYECRKITKEQNMIHGGLSGDFCIPCYVEKYSYGNAARKKELLKEINSKSR